MRRKLTDKTVRSLKAPPGKYVETWDTEWKIRRTSFGVRTSGTTGSKSWVLTYRKDGRDQRMTLGPYPGMTLTQARDEAEKIASSVVLGADPVEEEREAERKALEADTFEALAEKFVARYPKERNLKPSTAAEYERVVRKLVARWGDLKASEITKQHVIDLLDEITLDREAPFQANRTRFLVQRIFAWAVLRDLVPASPAAVLPDRNPEPSRDRVLTDAEIKTLWEVLDDEQEPIRTFYRFLILTGQRTGETRLAKWSDVEDGVWSIPAANTKSKRSHRVPLSWLALRILEDLRAVNGSSRYVFETSSPRGSGPVRWIHRATERIRDRCAPPCPECGEHGRHVKVYGDEAKDIPVGWYCECVTCGTKDKRLRWSVEEPWRAHDLRRTLATGMASLGVDRIVIERAENRTDASVASIYDRYAREPEVKAAFEKWAQHVEQIVSEEPEAATATKTAGGSK
jgi:integrase